MGAGYEVRVTARAQRDLRRLPEKVAAACLEFLSGALAENPYRVGKRLHNELAGMHSARRGSYRVVYAIDEDRHVIEVDHIDHRRHTYHT